MVNSGISINSMSMDRMKRAQHIPKYSSPKEGNIGKYATECAYSCSMGGVIDYNDFDLMKDGDYGVMIIESKTNSSNKTPLGTW